MRSPVKGLNKFFDLNWLGQRVMLIAMFGRVWLITRACVVLARAAAARLLAPVGGARG